jgi:ligand-binding sensor domain-containing protein/signal transduction histidine kinase
MGLAKPCMAFRDTRRKTLVALFAIALTLPADAALRPDRMQPQYTRTVWRVQDGLPEDTVQALAQATDGSLWIGTTGGLTRFDGTHFKLYGSAALSALSVNSVFCLTLSRDGSLWVGTEGGGLLHLLRNSTKAFGPAEGLTDTFVRSVLEDSHGVVWAGTDNGLFRITGDQAKRVEMPAGIAPLAVHEIAEDREGNIWVGGSKLLSIQGGQLHFYSLPGTYSSNRVKTIFQTADGTLWVGTVGGLQRRIDGKFRRVPEFQATVRTLKQTSDGTLWIGTIGKGLWTYKDGAFTHLTKLLPGNTILKVIEDESRQVWVGLQDGLVRLSQTPVQVIPLPSGSDSDFETISGDSGGVWVVASSVYRIKDGKAWLSSFPGVPNVAARNVFRDRQGDLWIGTDGSGAYHITPHGTIHYSAPHELTNNFIRVFLETTRGEIWIGTDEGVSRITAQSVRNLTMKNGLIYSSTRSMLEDRNGDIWIGTDQGLSHWRRNGFVQDELIDALRHEKVWSILQDTTGTLWFGTRDHGLFRYQDGKLAQFTTAQGLVSNSIYQILEDPQRRLWLSGPNTISSLNEWQMHQEPGRANQHLSVSLYTMPYGAEGAQMYGGRQPSGYLDANAGLWFPTNKGVAHVIPENISSPALPDVVIDSVTLDGRSLPMSGTIQLPANMRRLEFNYSPLSLQPQQGVRFQYKLEGFDKDWVYAGTHTTASYTSLPVGTYRFRVDAFNLVNPALVREVAIVARRVPFVWQRWWVITLGLLVLFLIGWTVFRLRIHQVKLRFRAVIEERARLAREMHDTVIQGCTGISALLEGMACQRSENHVLADDLLHHARTQIRTTIDEARHAVWNLRHDDAPALDLTASIDAISVQTQKDFRVPVSRSVHGAPIVLPSSTCRELLLVLREAVHNAALHGRPHDIEISVRYERKRMVIAVKDDGVGFSTGLSPAEGHFGITGMRERMERLGGTFLLNSTVGGGTRVELVLERNLLDAHAADSRRLAMH